MFQDTSSSIIERIKDDLLDEHKVSLYIKREDKLHAQVSGNKWRKLKYNVRTAIETDCRQLLTFGGAFSNHVLATAAAGKLAGLKTIGVIRGEEADLDNPTLSKAIEQGMHIHRISRESYRRKEEEDFINSLKNEWDDFYLIPEGGSNKLAVKGVSELMDEIPNDMEYIMTAVGTGATIAGIITGSNEFQKIIGIPVLKGADFLEQDIRCLLETKRTGNWTLNHDYHFKGYAKFNHNLVQFINDFKRSTSIPLDPIYTGKLMFGVFDLIKQGFFPKGAKILVIHTGGLQGIDGFNERFDEIIF